CAAPGVGAKDEDDAERDEEQRDGERLRAGQTRHRDPFCRYQAYVARMPSSSGIFARQPRPFRRETSSSLRGVPSGLVPSQVRDPSKPTTFAMSSASSFIETSSPTPTLTISAPSYSFMRKTAASARSSTWRNSRRGEPEPHTTTSFARAILASCILRRS